MHELACNLSIKLRRILGAKKSCNIFLHREETLELICLIKAGGILEVAEHAEDTGEAHQEQSTQHASPPVHAFREDV